MLKKGLFILYCLLATPAFSLLDLNITKGVTAAIPLAVVPFSGDKLGLAKIVADDLSLSGEFSVVSFDKLPSRPANAEALLSPAWQALNVRNTLLGAASSSSADLISVDARLYDNVGTVSAPLVLKEQYSMTANQARSVGHYISDKVYEQLTGVRGVFSTRLAYVLKSGRPGRWEYKLMVSDADGVNAMPVLISSYVIMSPAWSPDGKRLAYVSFESHYPAIYIANIATGARQLISKFAGINGAPAWSPDGRSLAFVLSKAGSPNVYRYYLQDKRLEQLTSDDWINTEPSFSPDGQSLLFTSNRDGAPQIYEYTFNDQKISRVSFIGSYNARASFTPDGEHIVFLHREDAEFTIAWQDLRSGELKLIVKANVNESPSLSPNGQMVVYAARRGGKDVLTLASVNGQSVFALHTAEGSVQEPAWAPFKS